MTKLEAVNGSQGSEATPSAKSASSSVATCTAKTCFADATHANEGQQAVYRAGGARHTHGSIHSPPNQGSEWEREGARTGDLSCVCQSQVGLRASVIPDWRSRRGSSATVEPAPLTCWAAGLARQFPIGNPRL